MIKQGLGIFSVMFFDSEDAVNDEVNYVLIFLFLELDYLLIFWLIGGFFRTVVFNF